MPLDTTTQTGNLAHRRDGRAWPAWFTTEQKLAQLAHEAAGCPAPWPGAVWNGHNFESPKPVAVS